MFPKKIIEIYRQIDPKPLWDKVECANHTILSYSAGSRHEGCHIKLQLKLLDSQIIQDTRFSVFGDPFAIAATATFSHWLQGKKLNDIKTFCYDTLIRELEIPQSKTLGAVLVMGILA